jgi:hypothetical protein
VELEVPLSWEEPPEVVASADEPLLPHPDTHAHSTAKRRARERIERVRCRGVAGLIAASVSAQLSCRTGEDDASLGARRRADSW